MAITLASLARIDHDCHSKNGDWHANPHAQPVESAAPADEYTNDELPEALSDAVDVRDVRSLRGGELKTTCISKRRPSEQNLVDAP